MNNQHPSGFRVVIVCGGSGTRLQSKLKNKQKCLAPVQGKPILLHTIDALMDAGLLEFDLIAGESAQSIAEAVTPYCNAHGGCVNVLPICESGTGRAVQAYWANIHDKEKDIVYSHGNIIIPQAIVRGFLEQAYNDCAHDVTFLGSPEWVAETHAQLIPRNGSVVSITTDAALHARRGLCSVGMAFIRRTVLLNQVEVAATGMFEDVIEHLRIGHNLCIGYYYTDSPWEHLGVPADWDRLIGEDVDHDT